jgi:hypothetical protein
VLPAVIFAVYFAFMSWLIGYACWTARPVPLPEVAPADLVVLEPDRNEGGQQAA